MTNQLEITDIIIFPVKKAESAKAYVRVIINDALILHGIRIIKGRFGHFISFPQQFEGSPHKHFDCYSVAFRKRLQDKILEQYRLTLIADENYDKKYVLN